MGGFAACCAGGDGAGVPVVAVNVSGLSEIIEHEKNGQLVDERSGKALAWAVRAVVENQELRTEVINQAHQHVRNRFSEENMLSEILKICADGVITKTMAESYESRPRS